MSGADSHDGLAPLIRLALEEDVGTGDVTTLWTMPRGRRVEAQVVAKADAILAGTEVFRAVYHYLDAAVGVDVLAREGSRVGPGDEVIRLEGSAASLLTGERVALNFLGHLSGVATLTRAFVDAVAGTGARIADTRKTTPGWRLLEKAAVSAGGGTNHRMGLYDMVLIKDNHIAAAGGIRPAVAAVRRKNVKGLLVEVEVTDSDTLDQALRAGVDRVLLDNMTPRAVAACVDQVAAWDGPRPALEASGNVTLENVRAYAEAGVQLISVGAITHSAPTADFSMRVPH